MAIEMFTVNEDGMIKRDGATLKLLVDEHPVWKARNALALGVGEWLYAPQRGHTFAQFKNVHASEDKIEEFQKVVRQYLVPYGPEITERYIERGQVGLSINITRETLNYG